jgi:hypothetical protein
MYGTRVRITNNTMLQDEGHQVSIQKMPEPFKYKLAHDVLDSNGTATGETESEDFEITELCRLSPEWTLRSSRSPPPTHLSIRVPTCSQRSGHPDAAFPRVGGPAHCTLWQ